MYKEGMTKLFHAFFLLSGLVLAGCATSGTGTTQSLTDIIKTERGSGDKQTAVCTIPDGLIGKPHTEIQKLKITAPVRVIFPNDSVTSDNVANRLNFKVDKNGIIKSITCG